MQALRFAATKIQPPRQWVARVERPQLDALVREAMLSHRVVLLQAAAAFGRTSTLAAQLAHPASADEAWARVALDEDDDTQRLFACLVAALERFGQPWRTASGALVERAGHDSAGRTRAATEQRAELIAVAQRAGALQPGAGATASTIATDDLGLSTRERALLQRIAAGDSDKRIARALDMRPHNVQRHDANILDKLVLASRGQGAAWLREQR